MRKTVLVVLSLLGLALGPAVHANAAGSAHQLPAYRVTLHTSVASSTADHFIVVSGKVTGAEAAGHSVTIQRRYDGGPWISVATATIKHSGKYAARVETPRGGWTSFRALKARSSVRKAGASAVRQIPVYRWISLASSASIHDNHAQPGVQETVGGKTYPSIDIYNGTDLYFKLADTCTKFSSLVQYSGQSSDSVDLTLAKYPNNGGPATPVQVGISTGAPVTVQTTLVRALSLGLFVDNFDTNFKLVLANPRAYCNADTLPLWTADELK